MVYDRLAALEASRNEMEQRMQVAEEQRLAAEEAADRANEGMATLARMLQDAGVIAGLVFGAEGQPVIVDGGAGAAALFNNDDTGSKREAASGAEVVAAKSEMGGGQSIGFGPLPLHFDGACWPDGRPIKLVEVASRLATLESLAKSMSVELREARLTDTDMGTWAASNPDLVAGDSFAFTLPSGGKSGGSTTFALPEGGAGLSDDNHSGRIARWVTAGVINTK